MLKLARLMMTLVMAVSVAQAQGGALERRTAPDTSVTVSVPANWTFEAGKGMFSTTVAEATPRAGANLLALSVYPTSLPQVPGELYQDYLAPEQAAEWLVTLGGNQNVRTTWARADDALVQMATKELRRECEASLVAIEFTTGAGIECVVYAQVLTLKPLTYSGIWGIVVTSAWAPKADFQDWAPTLGAILQSTDLNQRVVNGYMLFNLARCGLGGGGGGGGGGGDDDDDDDDK